MKRVLSVSTGSLREHFMDTEGFQRLIATAQSSARLSELNDESVGWVEDELYTVGRLEKSDEWIALAESGRKYNNPDGSTLAYLLGITDELPGMPPKVNFNRGRSDAADIDVDFEKSRRHGLRSI